MKKVQKLAAFALPFALFGASALTGQSAINHFRAHNQQMAAFQPALISPLVAPDPRLLQYVRFSVAHQYTTTGTETLNFGNCRGVGVILRRRFQVDWVPPPYIEHHSKAVDGAGDTSLAVKFRIASGNAENGNFDVAAGLTRTFATGSHSNGAASGSYAPSVIAAVVVHRFVMLSSVVAVLPTQKTAIQGRAVAWNGVLEKRATKNLWFDLENNSTFYYGGTHDGHMQNFITPGAFYVLRRKDWSALHPYFIVDGGMQIATSRFHTCNHNLITEIRMLF